MEDDNNGVPCIRICCTNLFAKSWQLVEIVPTTFIRRPTISLAAITVRNSISVVHYH